MIFISVAYAQEESLLIKSFELDGKLEIIGIDVITNNNFYSQYYGDNFKQETTEYTIEFYKDESIRKIIDVSNGLTINKNNYKLITINFS